MVITLLKTTFFYQITTHIIIKVEGPGGKKLSVDDVLLQVIEKER